MGPQIHPCGGAQTIVLSCVVVRTTDPFVVEFPLLDHEARRVWRACGRGVREGKVKVSPVLVDEIGVLDDYSID